MKVVRLWPHQEDAVQAACGALAAGGRAQVVMAMGTGKTLVGQAAAARLLRHGGTVAVLVPSLALVYQTLRAWRAASNITDVLTVCSADDPGEAGGHVPGADGDDLSALVAREDAWAEATTDPGRIAQWLAADGPRDQRQGLRLLLATYHSGPRIADAFAAQPGLSRPGLIVFDEAHRAAADPEALFATALHDDRVPAERRMFLTATPRLQVAAPDDPRAAEVFQGMSDESLFGPRVYELGVAEAIERRLLSDYRVVVIGITDAEVHKLVLDNAPLLVGPEDADARTVAVQIALAQAARAYDLRRVLVFHNRVESSRRFARVLPHVLGALPGDLRPGGLLTSHHVDGTTGAGARELAVADLGAPGQDGWTVVSNVRVLSEGVDCPALDAVVFADPREGQTSTVQAIGRALRLHPERDQPAVILIPVYLAPGENGELAADDSDFRAVWQILRALRDRDQKVGAQLVAARRDLSARGDGDPRPVLPDWLDFQLPAGVDDGFLTAFSARLLDGTAHLHDHGLGRLMAYVARHGHAAPPQGYLDETGFKLGSWVGHRRNDRVRGILDPGLAAELEALPGWTWQGFADQRWHQNLARLRAFSEQFGHADIPASYRSPDGSNLGTWVGTQRAAREQLPPDKKKALEAVPGWGWSRPPAYRYRMVAEVARYCARNGPCAVPYDYRPDHDPELPVGGWLRKQFNLRPSGQIDPDLEAALEAIPGFIWGQREAKFASLLRRLADYAAEHGTATPPASYVSPDGYRLGQQAMFQRLRQRSGQLPASRSDALDQLPGWSSAPLRPNGGKSVQERFTAGAENLRAYAEEHGTCAMPARTMDAGGRDLAAWVARQRKRYRDGTLPAERRAILEAIPGWYFDPAQQSWDRGIAALRAYVAEHGTAAIPRNYRTSGGFPLASWARQRRDERKNGRLAAERKAVLDSLPGWHW